MNLKKQVNNEDIALSTEQKPHIRIHFS